MIGTRRNQLMFVSQLAEAAKETKTYSGKSVNKKTIQLRGGDFDDIDDRRLVQADN